MLLSIDGTFLVQILNLIVFWVLLNYVFIAPTRRAIEARLRYIEGLAAQTDESSAQVRDLQGRADAILNEARRTVDESMRAAGVKASDEVHAIEQHATEEAAATIGLAHATVASERVQAIAKQEPFVKDLARTMADRALTAERVA
jgi:F-type H+-transporting ATPase subunit b